MCVECGLSVSAVYREYTQKGNIRLEVCPHCGCVADKYAELEMQLVFIDLLLHRPQAYRHILFNRRVVTVYREIFKFLTVVVALDRLVKFL